MKHRAAQIALAAGAALMIVAGGAWGVLRLYTDEASAILLDTETASWIRADERTQLYARPVETEERVFRRDLELLAAPEAAALRVRCFRRCRITLNDVSIEPEESQTPAWVYGDTYQIARWLRAGDNSLVVAVENDRGPPALLVESDVSGWRTGAGWSTVGASGRTAPARLLSVGFSHTIGGFFPSTSDALRRIGLRIAVAFALGAIGAAAAARLGRERLPTIVTARRACWLLLVAWVVLCANNLTRLPLLAGFDAQGHLDYVKFITEQGRLPLATEGWQTFQSPLYYLLAACLRRLADLAGAATLGEHAPRVVSMLCGAALIVFGHRAAVHVFATRADLQLVATVVAGTVPVFFYMCQLVGNEPLAGAVGAGLLCLCLRETAAPRFEEGPGVFGARLGVLFGIALLAKVSALLFAPILAIVLWLRWAGNGAQAIATSAASLAAACGAVSGWYFLRNWQAFGRPFASHSVYLDPAAATQWWQAPGYRTASDVMLFGEALVRPIWSGLASFWDGIYATLWLDGLTSGSVNAAGAPPWSYDFMVLLAPLALPLSLAVVAGGIRIAAVREVPTRAALVVATVVLVSYFGAIAYVYATLPIYSTVKASYALAATPALGLLAAFGAAPLLRSAWGPVIIAGHLAAWIYCVFAAFFIVKVSPFG